MRTVKQTGIYARVSSEQQAVAKTIASQLAALRERVASDGLELSSEMEFIDEGYSGATLIRPALERLRDLADVVFWRSCMFIRRIDWRANTHTRWCSSMS